MYSNYGELVRFTIKDTLQPKSNDLNKKITTKVQSVFSIEHYKDCVSILFTNSTTDL